MFNFLFFARVGQTWLTLLFETNFRVVCILLEFTLIRFIFWFTGRSLHVLGDRPFLFRVI